MIDEHKEELASLYALDQLQGAELEAFRAELARDPELRALTESLQNAAAQFALSAPPVAPSPQLRARIFASIDKTDTTPARPVARPSSWAFWTGWILAGGFGIAAVFVATLWMRTRWELSAQQTQAELAAVEVRSLQQQLEANRILTGREIADLQRASSLDQLKIAKLTALNGNSPAAVAIAVWNPLKQQGVLTVEDLPQIGADQSYQLWVVDAHHKNPVNGGVFSVDEKGRARIDIHPDEDTTAATVFAISRERKGGVPVREGPIVAAGAL